MTLNSEKVLFSFFTILALALNSVFVFGQHQPLELFAALVAGLICTVMKFGDKSSFGATMLAAGMVADLLLISAALIWGYSSQIAAGSDSVSTVTSLASGALVAQTVAVILLLMETGQLRK